MESSWHLSFPTAGNADPSRSAAGA